MSTPPSTHDEAPRPALLVDGLTVATTAKGRKLIDDVSLHVAGNETLGIVG